MRDGCKSGIGKEMGGQEKGGLAAPVVCVNVFACVRNEYVSGEDGLWLVKQRSKFCVTRPEV